MSQIGYPARLRRVLIIADDVQRGHRLTGLLRSEGLESVVTGPLDGADAVGPGILEGDFAVVVVDERCLGSSAGEMLKALRKTDPELRIVVDTGNGFPGVSSESKVLDDCPRVMRAADSLELLICVQRSVRARYEERLQRVEEQLSLIRLQRSHHRISTDPPGEMPD